MCSGSRSEEPGKFNARRNGFSLIELLCVLGIIGILLSLLLPAVLKAYSKIRNEAARLEAPEIDARLRDSCRRYCAANPHYKFESKEDFMDKIAAESKVRHWISARSTQFMPFNFLDPSGDTIVLTVKVDIGWRKQPLFYAYNKWDLSITPPEQ